MSELKENLQWVIDRSHGLTIEPNTNNTYTITLSVDCEDFCSVVADTIEEGIFEVMDQLRTHLFD